MGDSSKYLSSAHDSHLQKCDSFKFIDDGDSVGEDSTSNLEWQEAGSSIKNSVGASGSPCNGRRCTVDELDKPVPSNSGDALGAEAKTHISENGHDGDVEPMSEPIISPSMILGKEANGFDEAAQVEGSEEEVRTSSASPTNDDSDNSGSWCQEDISDSEPDIIRKAERQQIYEDIVSRQSSKSTEMYELFPNEDGLTASKRSVNGQSNLHKSLYSSNIANRSDEYVGYGKNTDCYNHSSMRPGNNNVYHSETYKPKSVTSTSTRGYDPKRIQNEISETFRGVIPLQSNYGLSRSATTYPVNASPSSPRPSTCSPSVSNSSSSRSSRQPLPYESTSQPPFGHNVDEQRVRESAVSMISPQVGSPKGMPKAELITIDDAESTATATSGNDNETAKKKKKKKKRTAAGLKSDSSDVPDKKPGTLNPTNPTTQMVTAGNESNMAQQEKQPLTYVATSDCGSPVMGHGQRTKAGRTKSGKGKKKSENVIKAREIEGNRGSEAVDDLVSFVEGKKKGSQSDRGKLTNAGTATQEKKKKQKLVSRSITTESSPHDFNGESSVMGRVVVEQVDSTVLTPSTPRTSAANGDDDHASLLNHASSDTAEAPISPLSPDDMCNDVFTETLPSVPDEPVIEKTVESVEEKQTEVAPKEAAKEPTKEAPMKETPMKETPMKETPMKQTPMKQTPMKEISASPATTASAAELEFTNFEGLIETVEEQPFEKYVGRKKKTRTSVQQQQQRPYSQPSYNQRGPRWSGSTPQQAQQQPPHFNNRVHGNGYNNAASIPYSHSGQKQYPNHRYPSNNNFSPYGPKATGPSVRPGLHPQGSNGDSRKSVPGVVPTARQSQSAMNVSVSGVSSTSETSTSSSNASASATAASTMKSPPVKEDFPPLRPSVSSVESTLPGRKGTAASATSASSSPSTASTAIRASLASSTSVTNSTVPSSAVSSSGRSSNAIIISTPSPAGDSETFRASASSSVPSKSNVNNASASATPRGDVKAVPLTKFTWNFFQVQQFLELLYPKENEKCNFYSEASKRAHYFNSSTTSGVQ